MNDWKPVLAALSAARSCVITSHVNPDGDALGSEAGLCRWLNAGGVRARIVNADPVPARYAFLSDSTEFEVLGPGHDALFREADVAVMLDVGRTDRIGSVAAPFTASPGVTICIDHHPKEGEPPAAISLIDPGSAATGEMLFRMMEAAGRLPDEVAARALYVAIMTDTGSFRHGNTTAETHRVIAGLMEHPIDVADLHDRIYGTSSATRMRLLGAALTGLEVIDGAISVLTVTAAMMSELEATIEDVDGFSELARGVEGCRVSAVFTELPGRVKVSLRSRGTVDVNRVARQFGGGGHAMAAGITAEQPFSTVRSGVIAALRDAL